MESCRVSSRSEFILRIIDVYKRQMFDNASDNIRLDKRNYGIDLLRLVSMFLIVVLHSLSRGALVGVSPFNIHYEVGFLIEALTYCAVNCFALISGYVGVDSKFKYRRIVPIWLQVVSVSYTHLDVYKRQTWEYDYNFSK